MKLLQFRYSPIYFFMTASIFIFLYAFLVAGYSNKVPSLAYIGLGNFALGFVSLLLKSKNKRTV